MTCELDAMVGRAWARNVWIDTSGTNGDTVIWLTKRNGSIVAYDNNGGVGRFSRIRVARLSAGTYYVKIRENGNNAPICSYQVEASWIPGNDAVDTVGMAGTWRGRAGTAQTATTLRLTQTGTAIVGTCSWYGKTIRCTGSISGSRATLYIGGSNTGVAADRWILRVGPTTASGTGYKPTGGTYAVSLRKDS